MAEISIGELSRRTGVSISALHFYERKGLIQAERSAANARLFRRSVVRRVTVIRIAQKAGLTLADIAQALASLPGTTPVSVQDWNALSTGWRDALSARIALLTLLRDNLSDCIGCGCLSLDQCPLANTNDRLAALGPGAHLLRAPDKGHDKGQDKGQDKQPTRTPATAPAGRRRPARHRGRPGRG
ncbi:MAG: redox-sensitive transcriptional activator SoxR [Pseudomonadota bacterium]